MRKDRAIQRVVIYGADTKALEAVAAAQKRYAKIVMIVAEKDKEKIEELKRQSNVSAAINISGTVIDDPKNPGRKIIDKELVASIKKH